MSNMVRRVLSWMMVVVMLMGMGTTAVAEDTAAIDLNGYEFVLASPWASEYVGTEESRSEQQELFIERIAEVEKAYNCTIEFRTIAENINEQVTQALNAGEKFADFVDTQAVQFYALKANNLIYDLSTIEAYQKEGVELWKSGQTEICTIDGGVYGIWRSNTNKMVMWVNTSMLERLNLEPIETLIDRNEWNWDKWLEYMIAATQDTNNDGTYDTYGVLSTYDTLALAVLNSNNASPCILVDGKYTYNGTSAEVVAAVNYYADLYAKYDVVAPEAQGDWDAMIYEFMKGNILFFPYNDWCANETYLQTMEDDYALRPLPMGPDTTEYSSWCTDFRTFQMPANCPNPEAAMLIMNALYQPLEGYGAEDEVLNLRLTEFRDDDSVTWKIGLRDNMEMMYLFPLGGPYYDFIWQMITVRNGENTAYAAMEGVKDTMQTAIDDTYKQ